MFSDFTVKKIVVPTDFSESADLAIKHAVEIAQKFDARLHLIHVVEKGPYHGMIAPSKKTGYDEMDVAKQKLQEDANELEEKTGLNVTQYVAIGRIHDEIVLSAEEKNADLIVMGTHGANGWEEFFIGSNAYKVVTQAPCPVLSIQESATRTTLENIVLPIDETPESRQKVKQAAGIAKKFGATIHIASLLKEDNEVNRYEFKLRVKQITEYLDKEDISYSENVLVGSNFATMTMNFAESKKANLIVMMTEQEATLSGFLIGPFAQQVVNHSRIPVLSVSPEDLTSGSSGFQTLG